VPEYKAKTITGQTSVSVVIAARNEEQNIESLISSLKDQTYSNFEVIIVDDHSTDQTAKRIRQAATENIYLLELEEGVFSKKKAMEKAILAANGELIIATDADCMLPKEWIRTIVNFYEEKNAAFIAGPVIFNRHDDLVSKFQMIDFMMLQGITASGIAMDLHYMCNGANLAFPKKNFLAVNGYEGIDGVATGDDMLLMHKIEKMFPGKIFYCKSSDAIVSTPPMPGWKSFLMQRRRWASKTFIYKDRKIVFILGFVYIFNCWLIVLLVMSIYNPIYLLYVLVSFITKAMIERSLLIPVTSLFSKPKLLSSHFILQPLHVVYTVFTGIWSQLGKYEWKGRKTK
jgi:glycosyltransferase involved in cell wall biosynthesis